MQEGKRKWEAVKSVEELRGKVTFYWKYDTDGQLLPDAKPPGPRWLCSVLGEGFFMTGVGVSLEGTQVTDAELADLQVLGQLQHLSLDNTKTTDVGLRYLQGLNQLRSLSLAAR